MKQQYNLFGIRQMRNAVPATRPKPILVVFYSSDFKNCQLRRRHWQKPLAFFRDCRNSACPFAEEHYAAPAVVDNGMLQMRSFRALPYLLAPDFEACEYRP
jgi:hypothetical protein